jgi:hypothetical protein
MLSLSEIISCWKVFLRELGTQRYAKNNRPEYIGNLIEMLLYNNIDYDTAKTAKKQVIDILTTEEGKKAKGKHKDWGVNISDEYTAQLYEAYPHAISKTINKIESFDFMLDWMESYFSDPDFFINIKQHFQEQVLESDWFKTGEKVPNWAIKHYQSTILLFDSNKNKTNNFYSQQYLESPSKYDEEDSAMEEYKIEVESNEEQEVYYPDPFDYDEISKILESDDDPNRPPMIDKETWEKLKTAPFNPTLILK